MALTPDERRWLSGQQEALVVDARRADIYHDVLRMLDDNPPRWWRVAARVRRARVRRKYVTYHRHVQAMAATIHAWCAAHQILTGEHRGPVIR